jgi:predicted nucleotidyltransferase
MASDEKSIPEMEVDNKYSTKKPIIPENSEKQIKEIEKSKKDLEKLKNFIVKKYSFMQALSLIPPQSIPAFIEEEEVPKETEKHMHLLMIVPEEKLKEIPKIKQEIVKEIEKSKQKIWLHVKTPVDIWELCLDSKFELSQPIAMSFPLYDKGILGALRVAEIHKSLVLNKFEKYVVSYVIGGSLVRGEAVKTSDVDVFVVINDTDVKRMPRVELKERLRGIIYQYVEQALSLAGVKNKLEPQVYLLTDFWEGVKDAHPVMFTFIRDGIPLYDRGTFMPWKALLKMGKLKPSPEAIDMFMSLGDRTVERVKRSLLDLVISDIYWGVVTPTQAMLMLYGLPPPAPKHLVSEMKRIFMDKEKLLEKKYIDILEEIVIKYYKGYEHEKIKEVSGKEVDKLLKDSESYLKRLKELKEQIEKRTHEKTILQIYEDVFHLLHTIIGKKPQAKVLEEFEKNYVKKGKFT